MGDSTAFEEAATRLRLALEHNQIGKLQPSGFRIFIHETSSGCRDLSLVLNQVSADLLAVICSDQLSNNNQIVAATAYCKTISHSLKKQDEVLGFLAELLKEKQGQESTIFLCHGIFQLNCWNMPSEDGKILLEEIFSIVRKFCCILTSTCYLSFKVLQSLLVKIHELHPNGDGVSEENFKAVLDIVLSNWENPLSGVRQQNTLVFNQLLLFNDDYWKNVLDKAYKYRTDNKVSVSMKHKSLLELTLNELSWTMKSKYFLLTSILQNSNVLQVLDGYGKDIIEGLTTSLSIPHLVSAGTDLYLSLLASLTFQYWQHWFLKPFTKVIAQQEPSLAIENIFNYWINPTLKKFPSVFESLVGETKDSLYSYVTLHKVGRKHGLCKWESIDTGRIIDAVKHNSEKIQSQALSLLCITSNTSVPPTEKEYATIQQFLWENVNSDNSALRQSILKSVTSFILRVRDVILYNIKIKNDASLDNENVSPLTRCFVFLNWLRSFLLFNLDDKCNYQRKVTSLEIYKIVLTCFGEQKGKSDPYKRKSNKNNHNVRNMENFIHLFKFESNEDKQSLLNCVFDEDNTIRSSAASILMTHYQLSESDLESFRLLFKKASTLCRDQIFYKAESGAVLTQVLVSLAYKSSSQEFTNVINSGSESFISVLLSSAEEQFAQLQDDLLKAASHGAFLYGTLMAVELLTSNTTVPELSLNGDKLERLISLVEKVTDYFISVLVLPDSKTDFAPSFGEMGMAIAAVVERSSVNSLEFAGEVDDTISELQLTSAQQLVLSCVWLNLKMCTRLCSELVSRDLGVRDSLRCVSVVVSVLRRCRHKGAIESAGLSLYHITSHLTRSDEPELVKHPEYMLESFLETLVGTTAATVSRRSAGLAILVHRLITGDSRPKKPLLHLCVSRLLSVAEDSNVADQEALVDLPHSQALHFLRTLVQESNLREHMVQYTLRISLVALTNLASPLWTIRNAALQLFGALAPKLVGQKPNQDQCKGNHYLAFEELYTHAQPLVEMILKEFSSAAESDSIMSHSKLMPLLTLVTNLTVGLETVLTHEMMSVIQQFQVCFKKLFKSRIFNVRKLSSKAHALFATPSKLVDMINEAVMLVTNHVLEKDSSIDSENELHAYVLYLTFLFERFEEEKVGMTIILQEEKEVFTKLQTLSRDLLFTGKCPYLTKALVFYFKFPIDSDFSFFPCKNLSSLCIGYPFFINKRVTNAFECLNDVSHAAGFLLRRDNHDAHYFCLKGLRLYTRSNKDTSRLVYHFLLTEVIIFFLHKKHHSGIEPLIFEVILLLLEQINVSSLPCHEPLISCKTEHLFSELLLHCLTVLFSKETLLSVSAIVLPITTALLVAPRSMDIPMDMDAILKVSIMIKSRSGPENDQDFRLNAAKSVSFLTKVLNDGKLKESECGELIWKSCIDLLQDEVTEVRNEISKCVSLLLNEEVTFALNPFISLESLFLCNVIKKFMTLERLVEYLKCIVVNKSTNTSQTNQICNPFDHGVRSIYAEEKVISQFAYSCLLGIKSNEEGINEKLKGVINDLKPETYWHEYK